MSTRMMLRTGGALSAAVLVVGLAACAPETVRLDPENRPTMAPEQTAAEACSASQAEVDALVANVKQQIKRVGDTVASGRMPDFGGFLQGLQTSMDAITEQVSNPEVLTALEDVRSELGGFAELAPPDSLIAVPGYLAGVGSQLGELQSAGRRLQQLCASER